MLNPSFVVPSTVPKKQPKPSHASKAEDRDRLDLRIDPELRARAARQAERYCLSLSAYLRAALVEKIERDESTQQTKK